MNEEQFFQSVKSSFEGFSPEVPNHLYAGIQEKMKKKRRAFFLGWSLNTWLLVVGIAGVGSLLLLGSGQEHQAELHQNPDFESANIYLLEKAHRSIEWASGGNANQSTQDEDQVDEEPISKALMMAATKKSSQQKNAKVTSTEVNGGQSATPAGVEMNSLNSSVNKPDDSQTTVPATETEVTDDSSSGGKPKIKLPVTVTKVIVEEKESDEQ